MSDSGRRTFGVLLCTALAFAARYAALGPQPLGAVTPVFLPQTGWTPAGLHGVGLVAVTFALAAFAARAVRQNPVWASTASVAHQILRVHPESYRAHWLNAGLLARAGERAEALAEYQQALEIWPHDPRVWVDLANENLGWRRWAALDTARHLAPLDPEAHDSIESVRLRWLERRGRR